MLHVEDKINNLKQKVNPKNTNPILQRVDALKYLNKSKEDSSWFQLTKQQITLPLFVILRRDKFKRSMYCRRRKQN